MSRPFDDNAKRRYLELLSQGGRRPRTIAADMGFTWETVRKHLRSDQAFAMQFADTEALTNERVEEVLLDKALDGDLGAIKEWLHNRDSENWQDRKAPVAVGGGTTVNIAIATTENWRDVLSNPELRVEALGFADQIPALGAVVETTGSDA